MKIAVFSDIHSNHIAFQTCMDYALAAGAKYFILLGDYISDCPYPQKTMRLLYDLESKYQCVFIRGNREEYMLDYRLNGERGWYYSSSCGCLLYTYENLTKQDLDFFETMDNKSRVKIDGFPELSICHGSPASSRELLRHGQDNTIAALRRLDTDVLICGHTHKQGTFTYGDKKLINPGSVGVPFGFDGKAQFAILYGNYGGWQEEYIQLDYDTEALLEEFCRSGLEWKAPIWTMLTKEAIMTGKDRCTEVLLRATQLCKEKTGEANWPDIPDVYWEQAVREIKEK